ncbi:MAG TPA: hypothetical protein VIC28_18145 [Thermoanaerobaculia bacterium]|jgi:type II secretory pathway component GspD/PulD (secretin)
MKSRIFRLGLLASLLAAHAALGAGDPLEDRIDISLHDASVVETFRSFGELMGANAVVDPALRGPVTVELKHVRVRTLLDAVCESIGCRWTLEPGERPTLKVGLQENVKRNRYLPASLKEPIDLRITNAESRDILKTIGQILSIETVEIDPEVSGPVTFDLRHTPVEKILDAVCQKVGCDWKISDGESPVLRVTAKGRRK